MPKDKSKIQIKNIPASKRHTLNAIAYAVLNESEAVLVNPYPALNAGKYNSLLINIGYQVEYQNQGLKISRIEKSDGPVQDEYAIDDTIALMAALRYNIPVRFHKHYDEDMERRILALRRLGAKFKPEDSENPSKYIHIDLFKPAGIKFSFQKTNYQLADFICLVNILGCMKSELLSKFDLSEYVEYSVYPFRLSLMDMIRAEDEGDELQRRLRRLKSSRQEKSYHYKLEFSKDKIEETIVLPSDRLILAYTAVAGIVQGHEEIRINGGRAFENDKSLIKLFARFGLYADQKKNEDNSHDFIFQGGQFSGKKIDEKLIMSAPYAFGPVALLAAFASDKTILRGLPVSSSLWQRRIDSISQVLAAATVRVGEIEDGLIIESVPEFTDVIYRNYDDHYLKLMQFMAAFLINNEQLKSEFFDFNKYYPHLQGSLEPIKSSAKSLAS